MSWPGKWRDMTHTTVDRTGYRPGQAEINAEAAYTHTQPAQPPMVAPGMLAEWIEQLASKAAPLAATGAAEAAEALARYQGRKP